MTQVIAHRGASKKYPENTVEAFRASSAEGADWVELDVRRTSDGALVIHHDAHLPDGRIIVTTASGDLPSSVPNLAEALDACGELSVNIEIKNDPEDDDFDESRALATPVLAVALARRDPAELLVSSFDYAMVDAVRASGSPVATALLFWRVADVAGVVGSAVARGHRAINAHDPLVSSELVASAHANEIEVNVWTVDDPQRMQQLIDWGVDGIVTNDPAAARTLLPR